MKKIANIVLTCMICIQMIGCNNQNANLNDKLVDNKESKINSVTSENYIIKAVDYSEAFSGIEGCAVFYNNDKKEYQIYNEEECNKEVSPCSSFKIISTLIGLKNGVLASSDTKKSYNGTKYSIEAWNKDLNLKEAFQTSCVWYFRSVIDKVGQETMQEELNKIHYGNCDISEWKGGNINLLPELNGFWLESSLKISPKEQVEVLTNIFNGKTDFSNETIETLKEIMLVDKNNNVYIYCKK
ncbi:penicillin-binding transpeptidase domain-containing protein [Clostridium sp. C2-6-12]|uniref:penicillin-binding transpeptidase domain-containing protein n=1 Tax=Clostridium sp. C2-6-12 TaxID=2698832 RepID=UPI001FAC23EA|nr:penicillin-binding transpeptidase domain-containing protein [Clostridium sp. C2-6-12]